MPKFRYIWLKFSFITSYTYKFQRKDGMVGERQHPQVSLTTKNKTKQNLREEALTLE